MAPLGLNAILTPLRQRRHHRIPLVTHARHANICSSWCITQGQNGANTVPNHPRPTTIPIALS
jgi:hypothetical protein